MHIFSLFYIQIEFRVFEKQHRLYQNFVWGQSIKIMGTENYVYVEDSCFKKHVIKNIV